MTFGAMAAWQAWLLLALAAAVAAAVFLVKLRPPRTFVPSLLLWRRVLDESRALTLWERIRRAVSLAITVLIALALALAVTRPGRAGASAEVTRGRLLIVLDSAPSMQARTESGETRWERAVAEARRLAAAASGGEVALATTSEGLVEGPTTDVALIENALDRAEPGGGGSEWPRLAGTTATHFITDGTIPRPLDDATLVHSVFEPAPNVAITAFDVRPSLSSTSAGDAYLEIANYAAAPQKLRLRLTRGSAPIFDNTFDAGPTQVLRQAIPIARGGDPALRARVDAPRNALAADDEAVIWVDRARPLAVTIVGAQTGWLKEAFARDPDVRATFLEPSAYTAAVGRSAEVGALIFDRWAPGEPPERPSLLFAPPPATAWLLAGGIGEASARLAGRTDEEARPRWDVPGTHPVVAGVDPFTLSIDRARPFSAPGLLAVASSARGTPLVCVKASPGSRLVLVTFGPHESNLAAAPGFPVLIGNALEWLTRPYSGSAGSVYAGGSGKPGLMTFDGSIGRIAGPGGAPVPVARVGETVMALLREPGLYVVEGGGARSTLAVNIGDPQASNLLRTSAAISSRARPVTAGASRRPWWVYCVVAAFLLVVAEWWTWQRRITV